MDRMKTQKTFEKLSTALKDELKDTLGKGQKHLQVRPKIGHEVTDNQIGLIETTLGKWNEIDHTEQKALDLLLAKNNRFFSIFD